MIFVLFQVVESSGMPDYRRHAHFQEMAHQTKFSKICEKDGEWCERLCVCIQIKEFTLESSQLQKLLHTGGRRSSGGCKQISSNQRVATGLKVVLFFLKLRGLFQFC